MIRFGHPGTSSLLPSIAAVSNKRCRNICCVKLSSDSNSNQSTSRSSMIRDAAVEDRQALIALAGDTGLFPTPEELAEFTEGLDRFYEGSDNVEHAWLVCEVDGSVAGAAYYAPDGTHYPSPLQDDGVWNMYFTGVQPSRQRHGVGSRLLEEVETQLRSREGKRLVIETSGKGSFEHIRAFYAKHGYDAGVVTADFYGPGDDKVMFNKFL